MLCLSVLNFLCDKAGRRRRFVTFFLAVSRPGQEKRTLLSQRIEDRSKFVYPKSDGDATAKISERVPSTEEQVKIVPDIVEDLTDKARDIAVNPSLSDLGI